FPPFVVSLSNHERRARKSTLYTVVLRQAQDERNYQTFPNNRKTRLNDSKEHRRSRYVRDFRRAHASAHHARYRALSRSECVSAHRSRVAGSAARALRAANQRSLSRLRLFCERDRGSARERRVGCWNVVYSARSGYGWGDIALDVGLVLLAGAMGKVLALARAHWALKRTLRELASVFAAQQQRRIQ